VVGFSLWMGSGLLSSVVGFQVYWIKISSI
jgi:hypothetical protein